MEAEVQAEAETLFAERRAYITFVQCLGRLLLALALLGYLLLDALGEAGVARVALGGMGVYFAANLVLWGVSTRQDALARWLGAAIDLSFVVAVITVPEGLFTLDPHVVLVGMLTLLLLLYIPYSDPVLMGSVSLAGLAVAGFMLGPDLLALPLVMPPPFYASPRTTPSQAVFLMCYLFAVSTVAYLIASHLYRQVLHYSAEFMRRTEAFMLTNVERARNEKLAELNQLKRDFIALLSHELRTPITPLQTALEILGEELREQGEQNEMLDMAQEACGKLNHLIQDYSQLAELLTLEKSSTLRWNVHLADLLDELMTHADSARFDLQGFTEQYVSTDPRLLGSALRALMRRAELVTPADRRITLTCKQEDEWVVIALHDPTSYLGREATNAINDPFGYSSERAFFSQSTGLELVLAQHSIRHIGGDVRVESVYEEGTTVYCLLPPRRPGARWLTTPQLRQQLQAFGLVS